MSKPKTTAKVLALVSSVAVAGLLSAAPAHAKAGDVTRTGRCSRGSVWKLKLGPRGRVIETEFEVDSNVNGQRWSVAVTDNGAPVFWGSATTAPPSGSFTVRRLTTNRPGFDTVRARASFARTGESCVAAVSV
jgi:hypothetical protein